MARTVFSGRIIAASGSPIQMSRLARVLATVALSLCGTKLCGTNALPAGEPYVALVPWQVVEPDMVVDAPLALFWIPASGDDLRRSELLTSDELTLFASQCVAMRVVRLNDDARLAKLAAGDVPPLVVLTDHKGQVIGRVAGEHGALSVAAVETLVREELDRRAEESEAMLDRAHERADADDLEAAVALYHSIWEERCTCPRQARAAKKALRKLGRK
jgi:hypothetical protein